MEPTPIAIEPARARPRWLAALRVFGLVFAGWTVYGVLQANSVYWFRQLDGTAPPVTFVQLLRYLVPEAWLWVPLTLGVLAAAYRLPITATNWPHRVPLHLLFGLLFHLAGAFAIYFAHPLIRYGPRPVLPRFLLAGMLFDLFIYSAIVASVHAVVAHRQALRLRGELVQAELRMLRMQLQPHFLFNTLNAVSELIHRDPLRAERALARLGDLLRWSLQSSSLKEVSLREELGALEIYLDIQRLRHGDAHALSVVAEAAALDVAVPSLLLQPLVENAIRHGVHVAGGSRGAVSVEASRRNGRLHLRVSDTGRGLDPSWREGTGLRATRARLAGLYGDDHSMRLSSRSGGGTLVEVAIPAREVPA